MQRLYLALYKSFMEVQYLGCLAILHKVLFANISLAVLHYQGKPESTSFRRSYVFPSNLL